MRRLLLVTYVFPPEPSPGALRPSYLTRYLPQFGWDVTVLTRTAAQPPFEADVVHSGSSQTLERLPFRVRDALFVPDATLPWLPAAVSCGGRLLRERSFDAVLSTALPATVHVAGAALARKARIPWIADYRDPWAGNAYVRRGPLRAAFERALERRLLRGAWAITTISEPIAKQLRTFHHRDDVYAIPNAYDPAEWENIPQTPPSRFDLCYTGSMYDGKRSPDLLFAALAALRDERDPVAKAARVHFYGPNSGNVAASATAAGVTLSVRQHGVVSRAQAMLAQRNAAALLIFLNMDAATTGEMGSKFLEYIGARRPIVAFGPQESVMRDFIRRHRLGWFASNLEEAKHALRAAHAHYVAGAEDLAIDPRSFPTAPELARRFAERLDAAVEQPRRRRDPDHIVMEAS